jgi:hypothetical protein
VLYWNGGSRVLCLTADLTTEVRSPAGAKNFPSSLLRPDRLGDPPNFTYTGYRPSFNLGKAWPGRDADRLNHLVPRLRTDGSYNFCPPKSLYGLYRVQLYRYYVCHWPVLVILFVHVTFRDRIRLRFWGDSLFYWLIFSFKIGSHAWCRTENHSSSRPIR